jgi:hypothetical protein
MIRASNNVICSLLFQASLPSYYWVGSLHVATCLLNLLPTKVNSAPSPPLCPLLHHSLLRTPSDLQVRLLSQPLSLLPVSSPLTPIGVSLDNSSNHKGVSVPRSFLQPLVDLLTHRL